MKSNFSRSLTTHLLMLFAILSSCSTSENVVPTPEILVYLHDSWSENLSGHVLGADSKLYNLAIYANINEKWYNLPDPLFPLTPISEDGGWSCEVQVEAADNISKLSIYLLPTGYFPPILEGESKIPLKLNLVSAVKKTIHFN